MIEHSLFSLPFALAAFLLEKGPGMPWRIVIWGILAILGARNAANGFNRIADRKLDRQNPRTQARPLSTGSLSLRSLVIFTLCCSGLFILSAFMLGTLPSLLWPVAVLLILLYSYSKRFTWLSHLLLGACVAIAPMGMMIILTDTIEPRYLVLPSAVALWVAGFDVIYALSDIDFDRKMGLYSIPARFGQKGALRISAGFHLVSLLLFASLYLIYDLSGVYFVSMSLLSLLLVSEHLLVRPGRLHHIELASYHINEVFSLVFLIAIILEVWLV